MKRLGLVLFHCLVFMHAPASSVRAQALEPQPGHQHYERPRETSPGPDGRLAPRLQNLGSHTFPVRTHSEQAQLFINQGLNLSYGFNHAEAGRAFREAARLDPECAMAYWGQALVLGPNINAPMEPDEEPEAYTQIQKAMALRDRTTERESAYIEALATRYSGDPSQRQTLDRAYADAMRELSRRYRDDLDAATLFAEALMTLRPWNYWMRDDTPYPETIEAVEVIEGVLERHPDHPGALHLYIHLMEPTKVPEKALEAADRLLPLMPAAGHMVHMPSHIYLRVGQYEKAALSNELAIQADEDYIAQCRAQGIYPIGYYPHNIHFLWAAATFQGRSGKALESALKVAAQVPREELARLPFLQGFIVAPDYARVRFGRWQEILQSGEPETDLQFSGGIRNYARGMALIRTGRLKEAADELAALNRIVADPNLNDVPATFSSNTPHSVLQVALETLSGELAAALRNWEKAIAHLHRAVLFEDALVYTEPSDWHFPVRQSLGAVLLEAGRPLEAEVVYWEDLKRNPENGWSLFGLMQALRAQEKWNQADAVEPRFKKAWEQADIELKASRF